MADKKQTPNSSVQHNNAEPQAYKGDAENTIREDLPAQIQFRLFLKDLLNIHHDKENAFKTIELLKNDVDLTGAKLWILVAAILICSLGLNTNSTAVVIGAMLISPLMGPILGFGLGLGTVDFPLVKRSLRNLGITALFSVLAATIYFLLTPLDKAQTELLARTQPTIYDVLIAFIGGVAGILAGSTKSKGNVIPGVAIATALMPPLCTAGYGLANWNMQFFLGAIYLFIINSVFIALATYFIVLLLKFPKKTFIDKAKKKRIHNLIFIIAACTIAPSVFFGYKLIRSSVINDGVNKFIEDCFNKSNCLVRDKQLISQDTLEVVLWGEELPQTYIDSVARLMPQYKLDKIKLVVKQGLEGNALSKDEEPIDVSKLRAEVLQDFYQRSELKIKEQHQTIDSLNMVIEYYNRYQKLAPDVNTEAQTLFPGVQKLQFAPDMDLASGKDSVLLVIVDQSKWMSGKTKDRLEQWLKNRTKTKALSIVYKQAKKH